MPDWLIAIILGFIEGLTEFIPVSSTGHLLIAEHLLKLHQGFFGTEVFNAVIQSGAMLAALPLFSKRLATLKDWRVAANRDYFLKLGLAFAITVVGALIMKKKGLALPHTVTPIALALLIGGALFVFVEWRLRGRSGISEITWTLAVVFGLAQLVAIAFPGTSRSGATILFALLFGLGRGPAVEFSFLLGVPTLCAARNFRPPQACRIVDPAQGKRPWLHAGNERALTSPRESTKSRPTWPISSWRKRALR